MQNNATNSIIISGAREHNLKDISLTIPKNKLVVFTGLSGSGKSSLAFDTLYAEGQRRYVESLSSYARQFLGIMGKPDVDQIDGLSPAISIDQKTTSHNPRSTVGTITEIYDYLRLLFARVGHPHCPQCGKEIATLSVDEIVTHIFTELELRAGSVPCRFAILAPVVQSRKGEFGGLFDTLRKQGYQRVRIDKTLYELSDTPMLIKTNKHTIEVMVDRMVVSKQELRDEKLRKQLRSRIAQTVEESLKLATGFVVATWIMDESFDFPEQPKIWEDRLFSEKFTCSTCGISLPELEPRLFSFNSPQGACETCNGLGSIMRIDSEKIVAPDLSLSEGAIVPFARMMGNDTWWARLVEVAVEAAGYDFRKTAFKDMSPKAQHMLLHGSEDVFPVSGENRFGKTTTIYKQFEGFITNLERRYEETDSDFMRKEIEQFMRREQCTSCHGKRLKKEALAITINKSSIADVTDLTIVRALSWTEALNQEKILTQREAQIAQPIIKEVLARLRFLTAVGLNYLTLGREAATLAGGEAQRIRLASQIGTGLTGVLYILDEPTIGLHQRDNHRLIATLEHLRELGNSVVVVEHDRDIMLAANYVVDFGPGAGVEGGHVVSQGSPSDIMADAKSLTGKYLARKKNVTRERKKATRQLLGPDEEAQTTKNQSSIRIQGASHNNLKQIDVAFPLRSLVCVTGVSGSGKSTLLHETLYENLLLQLGRESNDRPGLIQSISVPDEVKRVTLIDQSPIGRTPRSNPATYTKIFDFIRKLFSSSKEAHLRGYQPGRFSFNVKGGRCETCQGEGQIKIEMQFLPDIYVNCDVCHGRRYNEETLQVTYRDKNIAEILDMSVRDAYTFFEQQATLRHKLKTLMDVGLGYLSLGQPAPTLSGGEAQRVKLARELSTQTNDHVVYLLDEPTTGLHFADVQKLLDVLHQLVAQNNTIIVIEHNLDIIKNADWIIDLGPEGGEGGGEVLATGTPETIAQNPNSFTGHYLKEELAATG